MAVRLDLLSSDGTAAAAAGVTLWSSDDDDAYVSVRKRRPVDQQQQPLRDGVDMSLMSSTDEEDNWSWNDDAVDGGRSSRTSVHRPLLPNDRRGGSGSAVHPLLDGHRSAKKCYTVEDAIEQLGVGRFQLKMFLFCGLFSITDSLEMMLLSVLSPAVRCEWNLTDWQVALISTIVFVGMFIGSNFWGSLSDKHGRRPVLLMAACWIGYFGILTSLSPNYVWIVILRGLVGVGFGGAVQNFTLLTEYLPSKYRAKVLIIYNVMWAFGTTFEIIMAYFIIPRAGWRVLVLISALPMIITLLCACVIPESSRYLLAAGHKEKAAEILKKISSLNRTRLPSGDLVGSAPVPRGRYADLLRPDCRRTVLLVWLMWFGSACIYYGIILSQSQILEMGGICGESHGRESVRCNCRPLSKSDYASMIIATFGEFLSIPLSLLTVDRLGRKWTLGINFLGTSVFCLLCQVCTGHVFLLTAFMFGIRSFITGAFNIIYIYTVEVLPTSVRSIGLGSSSSVARLGALLTPFVAQVLMSYSIRLSLSFYMALSLSCVVAAYMLPIETKGRPLQQSH